MRRKFNFLVVFLFIFLAGTLASSHPSRALAPTACTYNSDTAELLNRTSAVRWLDWIRRLSGVVPVTVASSTAAIQTRYSPQLFNGASNARAYDYVLQQLQEWYATTGTHGNTLIEEDAYVYNSVPPQTWKNLVLTIPGQVHPEQVVALSAHLDSRSPTPLAFAPGADDNATGAAALLEAARLMRFYQFEKTIKIIWFTGEEQGLLGSAAFTNDHDLGGYEGVVNLDMFGYDGDGDHCFEIHAGTLPESDAVGQCFAASIPAYNLNLSHDYVTIGAETSSDHSRFWEKGVGAVEILENYHLDPAGGCGGIRDNNPYYHQVTDTITNSLTTTIGYDISRAGIVAAAGLAGQLPACFTEAPTVSVVQPAPDMVDLEWETIPGAAAYRVYRRLVGSLGPWSRKAQVTGSAWTDSTVFPGISYIYRLEALAADGVCVSEPGNEETVTIPGGRNYYLPVLMGS